MSRWKRRLRLYLKRSEFTRIPAARAIWKVRERRLKQLDSENYYTVWGETRRNFIDEWGSIPCPRPEAKRLIALRNRYKGQRIFLMGNGPSLNQMPLERLADEYTFGFNRIYLLFDRISWKPTFYTVQDWRVGPDNVEEINALRGMMFFFPERFRGLLREGQDVYWYWSRPSGQSEAPIEQRFQYDISKGIFGGGTVVVTGIQIAYYMGFDPIYLIGVDADYKVKSTVKQSGPDYFKDGVKLYLESTEDDDPNHFDPRYFGKGRKWHNPNVPEMIKGFDVTKAAIESQGRHIYNATAGGKLEVFERVPFESLFD